MRMVMLETGNDSAEACNSKVVKCPDPSFGMLSNLEKSLVINSKIKKVKEHGLYFFYRARFSPL